MLCNHLIIIQTVALVFVAHKWYVDCRRGHCFFFFFFPFSLNNGTSKDCYLFAKFQRVFSKSKTLFFFLNSLVVSTIFHFSLKNGKIKQILSLRFVLLLFHFHFKCWFKNPQVSEKKMKKKKLVCGLFWRKRWSKI